MRRSNTQLELLVTARSDMPASQAAALMIRKGVTRLPVVDAFGTLVGIVAPRELLQVFLLADTDLAGRAGDLAAYAAMVVVIYRGIAWLGLTSTGWLVFLVVARGRGRPRVPIRARSQSSALSGTRHSRRDSVSEMLAIR